MTAKADQECRRLARAGQAAPPRLPRRGGRLLRPDPARRRWRAIAGDRRAWSATPPRTTSPPGCRRRWPRRGRRACRSRRSRADAPFAAPLVDALPGPQPRLREGPGRLRPALRLLPHLAGARPGALAPGRRRRRAARRRCAAAGYREAVLTGVHLGGWGRDLRASGRLPDLLRRCLDALPDLRLRLSSLHPNEVTPALLRPVRRPTRACARTCTSRCRAAATASCARMKRPYRRRRRAPRGRRPRPPLGAALRPRRRLHRRLPGRDRRPSSPPRCDLVDGPAVQLPARLPLLAAARHRRPRRCRTPVPAGSVAERAGRAARAVGAQARALPRGAGGPRARGGRRERQRRLPGCHQATTDNYETVLIPAAPGDGLRPGAPGRPSRIDHEQDGRLLAAAVRGYATMATFQPIRCRTSRDAAPRPAAPAVYIETYGCQMNVYDSQAIGGLLEGAGFRLVDSDLRRRRRPAQHLHRARPRRAQGDQPGRRAAPPPAARPTWPPAVIGICGCMAERLGDDLRKGPRARRPGRRRGQLRHAARPAAAA